MKRIPIIYSASARIASFGDDASAYIILRKFFKNYIQITEKGSAWISSLSKEVKSLDLGLNSASASYVESLKSGSFLEIANELVDYEFVIHAPVSPPYKINPLRFIMNSPALSHAYENKRYFREEFSDIINIPKYQTKILDELRNKDSYGILAKKYGQIFVIQDAESSGSQGTFIINSESEYLNVLQSLKKTDKKTTFVISEFIEGESASVQVCITKYGILTSGILSQLVKSPQLCNDKLPGTNKWCGGEIGHVYPNAVNKQALHIAQKVGAELSSNGYKGIFGIDLLITPENQVYAIEINARLTGFTHVVSEMQYKEGMIPMLLLHVLELSNIPYKVLDLDALPSILDQEDNLLSYLLVMNPLKKSFRLAKDIPSGVYRVGVGIEFIKKSNSISDLRNKNQILIQCTIFSKGDHVASGKRILKIYRNGESLQNDELNQQSQEIVRKVKQHFNLP